MANRPTDLDTVFQALADPTRRAVVQQLVNAPASVKELAEPFDMALPSFMKHLAVLEECGLITSTKVGRVRTCRLRPKQLAKAEDWLSEQRKWQGRTDRLAAYVEANTQRSNKNDIQQRPGPQDFPHCQGAALSGVGGVDKG